MVDIYGSHFEYNGISSRRYGLIFAGVDAERNAKLSGEINGAFVFNKKTKSRHIIDNDYSDFPVSYEVDIISDNEVPIGSVERREIEKWLFNRHGYKKLYLDLGDDLFGDTYEFIDGIQKRLYLNCRFINPERLEYNGGVVGYHATIETDSGMWWQDAITKSFEVVLGGSGSGHRQAEFYVDVDTDVDDYIYPKLTIEISDYGKKSLWLTNMTDSGTRYTEFLQVAAGDTIVLDGNINYISSGFYEKFSERNFPRLVDGKNRMHVGITTDAGDTGATTVSFSFEFNNRRAM